MLSDKYTAKWGVQMAGMNFQTRSNEKAAGSKGKLSTAFICINYLSSGFVMHEVVFVNVSFEFAGLPPILSGTLTVLVR